MLIFVSNCIVLNLVISDQLSYFSYFTYSCFEKGCQKKCMSARDKTEGYCGK